MRRFLRTQELSQALKLAMSCAERKSTMPILSHVLIDARKSLLTITASDLDREVSLTLPAEIIQAGTEAINGGMLADIAANARGEDISITVAEGYAEVKSGRSRYKVPILPATDFPALPQAGEFKRFELTGGHFQKAIAGVAHAADTIDTRPYLCGVFVHSLDVTWAAVATDGKRLARRDFPVLWRKRQKGC